jgi:MarR family transcriptional regulator, transcriptional regulator for hemolysin
MRVMSRAPASPPIGLALTRTARVVSHEFERAMSEAGGSVPIWQVLLLVRSQQWGTQSQLAQAIGVTQATLTHHLNALERDGLIKRWREPGDRRSQHVELTTEGEAMFNRLRSVAMAHDKRLRSILSEQETERLRALLDKLAAGVGEEQLVG